MHNSKRQVLTTQDNTGPLMAGLHRVKPGCREHQRAIAIKGLLLSRLDSRIYRVLDKQGVTQEAARPVASALIQQRSYLSRIGPKRMQGQRGFYSVSGREFNSCVHWGYVAGRADVEKQRKVAKCGPNDRGHIRGILELAPFGNRSSLVNSGLGRFLPEKPELHRLEIA